MQSELKQETATFPFLRGGGEMGELTRNFDWSQTVLGTPDRWPQSLRTSVSILLNSQFPMFVWWGKEQLTTIYNDAYKIIAGDKHPALLGESGREAWSEIWDDLTPLVENVFKGHSTWSEDLLLHINRHGFVEEAYFTFSYSPILDETGAVGGLFCAVVETTEKVVSKKKIEESEARFRTIVEQAPIPIALTRGEEMVFESINEPMIRLIDRTDVLNKPMEEVLPELKEQLVENILRKVWHSGETFRGFEVPATVSIGGQLRPSYYNLLYSPVVENGIVTRIIHVAIDVTEQVMARKKIEENSRELQLAIEVADLGTFHVDLLQDKAVYSARIMDWFGMTEQDLGINVLLTAIHPDDQARCLAAIENASKPGGDGRIDITYRVVHPREGSIRHLRSFNQIVLNNDGQAHLMIGVIQDVTQQILSQKHLLESEAELQRRVEERTIELENINKELQRSNQNLEEFAHAASHDLKEPIRKIHFFTDRLKQQLEERITTDEKFTFTRIESASQRMSALIDDLLLYSHVSQRPHEKEEVDLTEKVKKVLEDLDLDIQQKGAVITSDKLPVVKGYRRQLQQLFQNLIGNALKYNKPGVAPKIEITSNMVNGIQAGIHTGDGMKYYLIEVKDNGIGFEQENAERIFQMFQRLHGNAEYRGTGVGLSIAKKVAENHDGKIVAESSLGYGATFKVYLPVL